MNISNGAKKWNAYFNCPEHGQRILVKLASINKTQIWLAKKVGVSSQYINNILRGRSTPSVGLAIKICDVLQLDWKTTFQELIPTK